MFFGVVVKGGITLSGERGEFWIRHLFVRVRKRLQTSSQTVFIVAKSFSCRKEILNMFKISLRIYFSTNSCVCKTVVSGCKTVVNVCKTVISLCKRL